MAQLRAPWLVTFSVATLTPCCNPAPPAADPQSNASGAGESSGAAANSGATANSGAAVDTIEPPDRPPPPDTTAPPPAPSEMVEAHPFESNPELVNPLIGNKRVLWDTVDCYTLGRQHTDRSGISFVHQKVECPNGTTTLLANCTNAFLRRGQGDVCRCSEPEGNPPMPGRTVTCPR